MFQSAARRTSSIRSDARCVTATTGREWLGHALPTSPILTGRQFAATRHCWMRSPRAQKKACLDSKASYRRRRSTNLSIAWCAGLRALLRADDCGTSVPDAFTRTMGTWLLRQRWVQWGWVVDFEIAHDSRGGYRPQRSLQVRVVRDRLQTRRPRRMTAHPWDRIAPLLTGCSQDSPYPSLLLSEMIFRTMTGRLSLRVWSWKVDLSPLV